MLYQVLTSFLLMGVCLTVLLMVIVPRPALLAVATSRPSPAPMPRVLQTIDAELSAIHLQQISVARWDEEGGASGHALAGAARRKCDVLC